MAKELRIMDYEERMGDSYERDYKTKYVCFRCRKMFKTHYHAFYMLRRSGNPRTHACPGCGEVMVYPGLYFKPPKQDDVEAWQVAETLITSGYRFVDHDGFGAVGHRPRTKRQLEEFLKNPPEMSTPWWRK
jgi:hypothetical protein